MPLDHCSPSPNATRPCATVMPPASVPPLEGQLLINAPVSTSNASIVDPLPTKPTPFAEAARPQVCPCKSRIHRMSPVAGSRPNSFAGPPALHETNRFLPVQVKLVKMPLLPSAWPMQSERVQTSLPS